MAEHCVNYLNYSNQKNAKLCAIWNRFLRHQRTALIIGLMVQLLMPDETVMASHHERRLYEDLMRDYNMLERPVENYSQPVTVYLKVSLQQIIDVDEKNQIIWANAWLDFMWNDYKLRWQKDEYGNITDVRFPVGQIWKPDVLLYNSVDANFDSTYPSNMIVYDTGDVSWVPPGIFKISCKIDIKWFPFDEQRCFFKFGSWTYNGFKLDLQPAKGGFDISEYLENGEWALPLTTVARSEKFYDCCPNEPYPDLTFYLHLRRRTLYYGFNLIMPCILTTMMSLLGFTLPPDAGEKITLQITVLLSICFFLTILSDMSPPTSEAVPLLGIFFSSCMIIVTASTIFTVYVLNLHYRTPETHEMGPLTRAILLYYLPYFLRMKRPGVFLTWHTLPSLIPCSRPTRHSESLIRNVKDAEAGGESRASLEIEQKVQQLIMMTGQQHTSQPQQCNGGTEIGSLSGHHHGHYEVLKLMHPLTTAATGLTGHQHQRHITNNHHHPHQSITDDESGTVKQHSNYSNKTAYDGNNAGGAMLTTLQKIHRELKFITKRMNEEDRESDQASNWKYAALVVDRLCLYVFTFLLVGTLIGVLVSAPYLVA